MSIRVTVCAIVVLWLCIQAWRGKWFMAACGAIVMMAFLERRDMPRAMMGIPGVNLWNLLMINTAWAWLHWRKRTELTWDFPPGIKTAFYAYLFVIVWSFTRFFLDPTPYYEGTRFTIVIGYLINPLKFLLPALILFDGCRSRQQMTFALGSILLMYFILGVLTIKYMGLSDFSGKELSSRAARVLNRDVGYHRVDMSMMLAGASWGMVAFSTLVRQRWLRLSLWGAAGLVLVGQALTGGRAGYVTWGVIGLTLCLLRWRKLLPLIPLAVVLIFAFAPGVRERLLEGWGRTEGSVVKQSDEFEVTAGRNTAWPLVVEKIGESPVIGYGRNGMVRTGLTARMANEFGDEFGHPHNAYLEILLDNGLIGFFCVLPLIFVLLYRSLLLFRDTRDPLVHVAGGVAVALLGSLIIAALSSQTFYPREGMVGMWAALGLALRAWVEREELPESGRIFADETTGGEQLDEYSGEPFPGNRQRETSVAAW
jgi:O-antigen ligase